MKMHEHVTSKLKDIMGSAQSNPNNTQSLLQSKHTSKCMKHCYNAMHDVLKPIEQKPIAKF